MKLVLPSFNNTTSKLELSLFFALMFSMLSLSGSLILRLKNWFVRRSMRSVISLYSTAYVGEIQNHSKFSFCRKCDSAHF